MSNKPQKAIVIKNAVVSYRADVVLHHVSLEVGEGEFVGIAGPNGAGKTTLLTLINGLAELVEGSVCIFGHERFSRGGFIPRKLIGYVPQNTAVDPKMPIHVHEVVLGGRYGRLGLLKRPGKKDFEKAEEAMEMVGIYMLRKRPIGCLSGGERQKVLIARAIAQEPKIMLLDEPTSSLDYRAQGEILNLIRKIHDKYLLTTLLVTHDLSALPRVCDRILLMKSGKVVFDDHRDKALDNDSLSRVYNTPISVAGLMAEQLFFSKEGESSFLIS
ncbi:MAG TPA: metal ABC transporter ATP-binding protein [Actinobacteria bacterium]|nr:metal ABC transporter ATP-binding protein [Actinomycetota bacterium]